jgi:hypothetical protein
MGKQEMEKDILYSVTEIGRFKHKCAFTVWLVEVQQLLRGFKQTFD